MKQLRSVEGKFEFIRADIRDTKVLADAVTGKDIIFNLAAQSSHTFAMQDPITCAEINVLGNLKLLEAVRLFNPEAVLVYTSTSTVIGKISEIPADETHYEDPLGIYSANKCAAEKYYQIYARVYGLKTIVLRFANLYGPWGKNGPDFGFVNHFIAQASGNGLISIYGEGKQLRNVMYVEDAVDILNIAAVSPVLCGGLFFATSPFHLSVREIAEGILRVFQRGRLEFCQWPNERKKIEVDDAVFSSSKLFELTGWQAKFDFESGLKKARFLLETENVEQDILK